MDVPGGRCLNALHLLLKLSCVPCLEQSVQLAFTHALASLHELFPVLLLGLRSIAPVAKVDSADLCSEEGLGQELGLCSSSVRLEVPLEGIKGDKLKDLLVFLAGHIPELLLSLNLLGVLFEGSERLLKQFLGVVSRDDRLI